MQTLRKVLKSSGKKFDGRRRYLAGVECDGATYHRSAAARDRDKTRQLVLEGLGWNILRIWSPDWWHDPVGVAATVNDQLNELLERDRSEAGAESVYLAVSKGLKEDDAIDDPSEGTNGSEKN